MWRPSRYNFAVRGIDDEVVLFNASTGSVLKIDGVDAKELARVLMEPRLELSSVDFDAQFSVQLKRGGFVVDGGSDELLLIRERYWRARGETPVVLTLTTTMDCNLGCYYCYEERSPSKLKFGDIESIVDLAKRLVSASKRHALHVDWYGGEPLLNLDFLELASKALQAYCSGAGINYVASLISNGTQWPSDIEDFVSRNRIYQAQISFDGLQENHDKRRHFRKGHKQLGDSSFCQAVKLVDRLVNCAKVHVRFNIDRDNQGDLIPFIRLARARGWFGAAFPIIFQPARLATYSSKVKFMRNYELSVDEYEALCGQARNEVGSEGRVEDSQAPNGFPLPRTSVCAALATNSIVVGADGLKYRCGLQVGENHRAVGVIESRQIEKTGVELPATDASWWDAFDPTRAPNCSRCSFLPICWGGCPKKHLEGDQHALSEQGQYWRQNLLRFIGRAANIEVPAETIIPESLQFR
ncbi:hypothetical protein BRAS3843_940018 [Bradyrhizobium sp. STM 3843]|uniref:radical SAM/SPASM domain-containing protein n=1 Tax=Bradyrhizobium sp. STM 3843 TaxID=551947 RepID=UPI00024038B5|nr:radical SAM protein [Bradyrhizobium sp. STM 3843]CCE12114.1 hypothetical protein BRAS3843_940018 [Bradyrhizobium sp. STM 3843]